MTLIERIDARIDKETPLVLHLSNEMCQQLIREDIQRWQEGAEEVWFGVNYETGEQSYRGVPIKVVGTGLRLD
jgi:hypothetical protein